MSLSRGILPESGRPACEQIGDSTHAIVRRYEKIKKSARIRPGPQGWFSWRTLDLPARSRFGEGRAEPLTVELRRSNYGKFVGLLLRRITQPMTPGIPKFRKESHPERVRIKSPPVYSRLLTHYRTILIGCPIKGTGEKSLWRGRGMQRHTSPCSYFWLAFR